MNEYLEELPRGWIRSTLGALVSIKNGFAFKSAHFTKKGVPLIRQSNLDLDHVNLEECKYLPASYLDIYSDYRVSKGDILIGMSGSIGNPCIYREDYDSLQNQRVGSIVFPKSIIFPKKYILYYLEHSQKKLKEGAKGIAVLNVSSKDIEELIFSIAPLNEQFRIVGKIEELLCELDKGVAELKSAQEKLTQYRQTLLKSAVEGTLTKEWREVNAHKINETGEQLLVRILKERRARWEKQKLEEFASKDQTPPKNWKDKYPEPIAPDTSGLPELPDGWVWASVGQICEIQGGIQKQPKRAPFNNKYPFLRVANVYRNELRLDDIHEIELFAGELNRLRLQKGDILIVEGNGSKTEIGRCALWDASIENAVHQNHLIRARPVLAEGKFIIDWLNSSAGMEIMSLLAATTSGLYTLSVSKISTIPVPIPSILEQQHISNLVSLEFESIGNKIKTINASLEQSDAQRKNILKDAFSGKLAEQNPSDEPASVLLEKIKVEREARDKLPKPKNPKKIMEKSNSMKTLSEVLKANGDWMDAQEAFAACGVGNGTDTDRIEELYAELRRLDKAGQLLTKRQGYYDMIKLKDI